MCFFFHFIHITEFTSKTLEQFISYKFKNAGDTLYLVLLMKLISNFENILEKKNNQEDFTKDSYQINLTKISICTAAEKSLSIKKNKNPRM